MAPDPTRDSLVGFTIFGPEPIDAYIDTANFCPTFRCRVEKGEVIGSVSSLGLWAEIVCPPGDPEEGTLFLFAVHNSPLIPFTGATAAEFDVNVFL